MAVRIRVDLSGLDEAMRFTKEQMNQFAREAMVLADGFLVTRTPVDTGRAKSNWLPTMETPADNTVDSRGANAQPLGNQVWSQPTTNAMQFWLSNNLPYIERLNTGYSEQAPPGYVETAVQQAVEIVNQRRVS